MIKTSIKVIIMEYCQTIHPNLDLSTTYLEVAGTSEHVPPPPQECSQQSPDYGD